mmetsp:Transcript_81036/g.127636  ORF Transcript_81036/g.127636 Transcript_81036/m.127636 type:complete len:227 (-) Transcript_81036:340-1020(-)
MRWRTKSRHFFTMSGFVGSAKAFTLAAHPCNPFCIAVPAAPGSCLTTVVGATFVGSSIRGRFDVEPTSVSGVGASTLTLSATTSPASVSSAPSDASFLRSRASDAAALAFSATCRRRVSAALAAASASFLFTSAARRRASASSTSPATERGDSCKTAFSRASIASRLFSISVLASSMRFTFAASSLMISSLTSFLISFMSFSLSIDDVCNSFSGKAGTGGAIRLAA